MNEQPTIHDDENEEGQEEYPSLQLMVFTLGQEEYAVPITQLKEILRATQVTPVPLTAAFVKGVANIRGNIIPIIHLAQQFGLKEETTLDKEGFILVVETAKYQVGFWISNVPNSITITENLIDKAPNIWQEEHKEQHFIQGIVKTQNRMIILVDMLRFIESEIAEKLILQ
ncbi:MAG: chemotaxis protein CheW [Thermonemataceae bacterium]